jgi:hypothetical protein
MLLVEFRREGRNNFGPVNVVEFIGNRESAPAEIPYLVGLSTAEVVHKYGEPLSRVPKSDGTLFLWFRNGIMVGTQSDKVSRYGIFDSGLVGN